MSFLDYDPRCHDPFLVPPRSWNEPCFARQADSLIEDGTCQCTPAPPPSPKIFPQGGYSHTAHLKRKIESLDESVFKLTPLRRVLSIDDEDEKEDQRRDIECGMTCDETALFVQADLSTRSICLWPDCSKILGGKAEVKSHMQAHLSAGQTEDLNDDTAIAIDASGRSSSGCSCVDTLLDEARSGRKRLTIRSRARKERILSKINSDDDISGTQLWIADKQISSPTLTTLTAVPRTVPLNADLAASNVQTWPRRSSYCPSRESPSIPKEEETSH